MDAACNGFLNALLREWHQWRLLTEDDGKDLNLQAVKIADLQQTVLLEFPTLKIHLLLPLNHYSIFHLHSFRRPFFAKTGNNDWQETQLHEIAYWTACEPLLGESLRGWSQQNPMLSACIFQERVAASTSCMVKSALYRSTLTRSDALQQANHFAQAEQALLYGHSAHPYPKYREGFTEEEAFRYLPEFKGRFPLIFIAVQPGLLWHNAVSEQAASAYLDKLLTLEPQLVGQCPEGYHILPVHPWQWSKLLIMPFIQTAIAEERIRIMGYGRQSWQATTSVRALYHPESDFMLKFSLSTRLTNSKRVLSASEVARGVWVHRAFLSSFGQKLMANCPSLSVMYEPVTFAIQTDNGPLAESFAVWRENPFPRQACAYVVATLCQNGIANEQALINRLIRQYAQYALLPASEAAVIWFENYLEKAVAPFVIALSDFGFLFSVHQQNMVLSTENGLPVHVYFRDCQGTAFSTQAIVRLQQEIPEFPTHLDLALPDNEVFRLAAYYLFINNVFAVAAALGREHLVSETLLGQSIRNFLSALKGRLKHTEFIDYLLFSPHLYAKSNLALSLLDINETEYPQASFQSYKALSNPIAI